jgi:hypothetical protein
VSGPLPGAVHDLTAARIWGIMAELAASGLSCWATRATSARTASARPSSPKIRTKGSVCIGLEKRTIEVRQINRAY